MADSVVQLPPDSTGKLVDCQTLTNGASQTVFRQTVTIGDAATLAGIQTVRAGSSLPAASDGAAVVLLRPDGGGSAGTNYSANPPSWPNIGANFSASGPYASWYLVATIPALATRFCAEIDNMSAAPILVLRDDGTALSGSAPVNPSAFVLNPKVGAGPEGGSHRSTTFQGRYQVYAASSSAFVSARID